MSHSPPRVSLRQRQDHVGIGVARTAQRLELGDRRMVEPFPTPPSGARSGSTATEPRGKVAATAAKAACEIVILNNATGIGPGRAGRQQPQLRFRESFPHKPLRSTLVWAIEKANEPINKLRCLELLREVARHLCLRLNDQGIFGNEGDQCRPKSFAFGHTATTQTGTDRSAHATSTRLPPTALGDVARIIAQRFPHKPLRLPLAGPVEEPEQIVNDGVGMHALGFHIRLQQPLRLGDQRILGANCGFEFGGSVVHFISSGFV